MARSAVASVGLLGRIGIPGALVVCLFLPWTLVSCGTAPESSQDALRQNGIQAALGGLEVVPRAGREQLDEVDARRVAAPHLPGGDVAVSIYMGGLLVALGGALLAALDHRLQRRVSLSGAAAMSAALLAAGGLGLALERKAAQYEDPRASEGLFRDLTPLFVKNETARLVVGIAVTRYPQGRRLFVRRESGYHASLALALVLLALNLLPAGAPPPPKG